MSDKFWTKLDELTEVASDFEYLGSGETANEIRRELLEVLDESEEVGEATLDRLLSLFSEANRYIIPLEKTYGEYWLAKNYGELHTLYTQLTNQATKGRSRHSLKINEIPAFVSLAKQRGYDVYFMPENRKIKL